MFKNAKRNTALLAGLMLTAGLAQSANTQTGTLTITGQIADTTCEISVSDASAGTYDFGKISHAMFDGANTDGIDVVPAKDMKFTVKNCPAATKTLHVAFQYNADTTDANLLGNTGTGKGVSFMLKDANDTILTSGAKMTKDVTGTADWATGVQIDGQVHAVRHGNNWAAGDIASQATYTLTAE
ncbi:fimbrial protein [Citrobacter freundii]|nr:type 1 fimbrial protein [Citrobacter freundii]